MTAHFIAPNTAADIRYALYFRVQVTNKKPGMIDPWENWPSMKEIEI